MRVICWREPTQFAILSDFDEVPELAEEQLIRKVRRGLNRRHLKKRRDGQWEIGAKDLLRGWIEWSEDLAGTECNRVLVIDGRRITMEGLGKFRAPDTDTRKINNSLTSSLQ